MYLFLGLGIFFVFFFVFLIFIVRISRNRGVGYTPLPLVKVLLIVGGILATTAIGVFVYFSWVTNENRPEILVDHTKLLLGKTSVQDLFIF